MRTGVIRYSRGRRAQRFLSRSARLLIHPLNDDWRDFGIFFESQDGVAIPVETRDVGIVEGHLLFQHSACGLNQHSADLILNEGGIDGEAGVERPVHALRNNAARMLVYFDFGDSSCIRGKMSTDRDSAPGYHVCVRQVRSRSPWRPSCGLCDGIENP